MKSAKALVVILSILLAGSLPVLAQSNVNEEKGMKPYDSWHGSDLDSVSMTNGGLVLHIPLAAFPQRGNLDLNFSVYFNTKQWAAVVNQFQCSNPNVPNGCIPSWVPSPHSEIFSANGVEGVYVASSVDWFATSSCTSTYSDPDNGIYPLYNWSASLTAPDGNSQSFGTGSSPYGCPQGPYRALDASGILWSNDIIMPNGTHFNFSTNSTTITDANGNRISTNGLTYTDTMGRVISVAPGSNSTATADLSKCPAGTASAKGWIIPGLAGGSRTFIYCFSNVNIYTNFGQGVTEYGPTNNLLLTAIVLPDSTQWTFAYDHYGDLTRLGLPTGGSISYTYAIGPATCGTDTPVSMIVTSRTVDANDGAGGHTWTYTYTPGTNTAPGTMVVTSPEGNDTVHTVGDPITGTGGCSGYDLQVQNYQGSHNGGTLLKTATTQYYAFSTVVGGEAVLPQQTTVSWPDGHSSKVVNTWDTGNTETLQWYGVTVPLAFGSLLQRDEYDYSNTLVRSTVNHYLWQDNATYQSNNFLGLKVSTTLKDGAGNQMAQTTYGYDQTAVTSSGITTGLAAPPAGGNIRGNQTTASYWLNTTNSFLSSTATFLDTGMAASSTPPANADGHNRTTTYTYSSTFAGAYMTQTNMPDTLMPDSGAQVVHHVISGNYDFNTGLLTSFTDENGQAYSYQYEPLLLRLTQGNHPDGGQTIFTYPDPLTVQRQRLISGSTYDSFTAKFDGLGRPIQSQEATPSGTILADTTYDIMGRVSTVSNPYYQGSSHSSDPTYGVTTSQYDALSRAIKTIKQNGSFSTVQYNATAADGASSSVMCTTATDEAGKQRQVCSDALGRMVKVLEPNPASTATNATGWVTVSGAEQSANSQPAISASVTVTLGGSNGTNSTTFCGRTCHTTNSADTGTIQFSVTAGGTTIGPVSATYGSSSTSASLAAALVGAFPSNSVVSISYSAGSSSFTLTTIATGSATNSSTVSTSLASNCVPQNTDTTVTACQQGWTITPTPSANFAGGQNGSSIADSGLVSVTINGTAYSTTFGAGDTTSMIASRLASAITAGAWASAVASGGTVNLTSKTAGTAGDYSLSTSYTWNSGQFNGPSFTTSISGSSLAGALDASAVNNNPYVTLYQYDARNDMLCVHQKATDTTADVACTGSTPPAVPAAWRQRFFTYNSFSQLLTALNPEAGQTNFQYDADGNVTSKTSPKPNQTGALTVTTTITYDPLNRPLDKTYSDGTTPNAAFRYDYSSFWGAPTNNPIGRMVAVTGAMGTVGYLISHDPMGRPLTTWQCTPGVSGCNVFNAHYDYLGDPLSVTYPANNFTVTYSYDTAPRLTGASDSNGVNYAQTPTYLASGVMQEFVSPNFNNNKFHADYNNRLQPIEIWAGPAEGTTALFDKKYSYNAPTTSQMNNGNIYTVTNVKDDSRTQSFTYDALNRLLTAGDKAHWANSYLYDAWGNLYQKVPGSPAGENMVKIADTNNRLSGMTYDAAGNVTNDGLGNTFVYDAENRIVSVTNSGVTTTYIYDALGRRIKKSSGATATNYWFGPAGETAAETDAGGAWTNYIFFGGQRLARNISGDIKYYITDHLHSTAVFADKSGAVLDDNDFYPWGGVVPGVGTTTSNNHYKFTGKERDAESQLDYFGARYYANVTGRFMSPDWAGAPITVPYAEFGDPQSLNLYSYVRNSPIVRVDPDGHNFAGFNGLNRDEGGGGLTEVDYEAWDAEEYSDGLRAQAEANASRNRVRALAEGANSMGAAVARIAAIVLSSGLANKPLWPPRSPIEDLLVLQPCRVDGPHHTMGPVHLERKHPPEYYLPIAEADYLDTHNIGGSRGPNSFCGGGMAWEGDHVEENGRVWQNVWQGDVVINESPNLEPANGMAAGAAVIQIAAEKTEMVRACAEKLSRTNLEWVPGPK